MTVVRLPAWSEVLAPDAPWGLVLRSGGGGLWLLRATAEEHAALRVCVLAASACSTEVACLQEWSAALEVEVVAGWDELTHAAAAAARAQPTAVLVADAERLLDAEPARLPALFTALAAAAESAAAGGSAFRVVFQSRFDTRPERLAVFHEFGAVDIR